MIKVVPIPVKEFKELITGSKSNRTGPVVQKIINHAIKAAIIDEWETWDGKELEEGDNVFKAKNEKEQRLWIAIRRTIKNYRKRSIQQKKE